MTYKSLQFFFCEKKWREKYEQTTETAYILTRICPTTTKQQRTKTNPYEKCWWSQFYQCWSPNKKKDDTTFECSSCNYKLANRIKAILTPTMYRHVRINLKLLQNRIRSRTFLHRIRFSYGPGQFRALSIHKSNKWKWAVTFRFRF